MTMQLSTAGDERERLEQRANAIRARLLRTIDALDFRRHQVSEVGHYAKRVAAPVVLTFVGLAVVSAGATFGVVGAVRRRRRRRWDRRLGNRLAPLARQLRGEKKPSIAAEVLRKGALAAASVLVTQLAKRAMKNMLDGKLPSGRRLEELGEPTEDRVSVVDAPLFAEIDARYNGGDR
ncbi:hypothetical protein AKJ09_01318 [Labilithrix luteola]|uniref:DUF3618 domain-containing protein n=1 Tax=Labilithrix luteola TaxID=1391654 RepID=A0A0K1PNG8_9BACT|nr:hypothetical protein [Labilithrix luteola]AKU94654.1 hypothetical protein AKJ09_01318 [Labilithrix luteola]